MMLRTLLEDAAASLPEVEVVPHPDGTLSWARAGRAFAVVSQDGMGAEFALDARVAAAAARTPDVIPSSRGPGWVVFRPPVLDDHAADRASAWFASAHRRLARD